ncbi:MAG TPA: hypothetical protein VJ841_03680 [Candidatus Saccharimonadales bacterium]|nr:hypothetical protein [Candidatus Saccharimonadales bacterium]
MESISKLENTFAEWYRGMPHLPKKGRDWLRTNIWWIVLVWAIIDIAMVVMTVMGSFLAALGLTVVGGVIGAFIAGPLVIIQLLSVAGTLVEAVLLCMAVNPLQAHARRGWRLVFLAMLLSVVLSVIGQILTFDLVGLLWGLLWAAAFGYFLFEVRDEFTEEGRVRARRKA